MSHKTSKLPLDNLYAIRNEIEGADIGGQLQRNTYDSLCFTEEIEELQKLGVLRVKDTKMILTMNPSEALDIVEQYIQMESI